MSLHQPTPFEYKNGKLVDAFGDQVRFRNKENLKVIAEFMNPDTNPDVINCRNEYYDLESSIQYVDSTIGD